MKDLASDINLSSEDRYDALLTHAHTKYGYLACKVADGILADACVCIRMARSGTDDKLCGILRYQVFQGDLIISVDGHCCTFEHKVLVNIPGEGVIIVDKDDVFSCG